MISQLEHDNANPSIETLRAIAAALEQPLFVFFLEEGESLVTIVRKDEGLHYRIPGSRVERQLLTYDLNRAMILLEFRIPPGAQSSESLGSHSGEECVLVLQGEVAIEFEDEMHVLEAGDTIYYDSRLKHLYRNCTDEDAVILIATTPPGLRPDRLGA
jgi:quercetin dioxygenase-like cupin family protein